MSSSTKQVVVTLVIIFFAVIFIVLGIRFLTGLMRGAVVRTNKPASTPVATVVRDVESDTSIDNITTVKTPQEQYTGRLTFVATVDEILGERAFVVRDSGVFESKTLVITKKGIAPVGAKTVDEYLIKKGDKLLIKGDIQKFDPLTIQKEARMVIDLDNLKDWNNKPAIVASSIDRVK